jgi:hypothetical protein
MVGLSYCDDLSGNALSGHPKGGRTRIDEEEFDKGS